MAETVVFNGVKFRRYPDAKGRSDRVYFTPGIADKQRGIRRLHEEIWMAVHGHIPPGAHIHHKDENPLNNVLENLECLPGPDHTRLHGLGVCSDRKRENLDAIRPLTKAWHGSEQGREWHRQHAHEVYAAMAETDLTCERCGETFRIKNLQASYSRFCSNACKSAWRRAAGLDDVDRICEICGTTYRANRYKKSKTCSRACGGKSQSRTKAATSSTP